MSLSESEIVLALRAAGCVFAEEEAALIVASGSDDRARVELVRRRAAGDPLEHLLGWAEFARLRVRLGPGVFVPRRRTEFLAEIAADLVPADGVLLDLCCGSGAIAAALMVARPGIRVVAADIDPVAVDWARRNLGRAVTVLVSDLFDQIPRELQGRVDVVTANVPYVPTDEIPLMPPEARDHEPAATLDGGADGLDLARRVLAAAPPWLAPDGAVLIELHEGQVDAAIAASVAAGLRADVCIDDERGATVLVSRHAD